MFIHFKDLLSSNCELLWSEEAPTILASFSRPHPPFGSLLVSFGFLLPSFGLFVGELSTPIYSLLTWLGSLLLTSGFHFLAFDVSWRPLIHFGRLFGPIDSLLVSFGSILLTSGLHFLAVGVGVFRQLELILDPCGINSEALRCVGKGIQYAIYVC